MSGGIEVLDTRGQSAATADGVIATWVDAQHFATWSPGAPGLIGGTVAIRGLDGSTIPVPGTYQGRGLIGDGAGALALMPASADGLTAPERFVVWTNGVLGASAPGSPFGWSPDGSQLIVAAGPPLTGTAGSPASVPIALLTRPFTATAQPINGVHVNPNYIPAFDQPGSEVAFQCAAVGALGGCHQLVLDLSNDEAQDVAAQPPGVPLTWLPNGDLLLAANDAAGAGELREWNGTSLVQTALPHASWGLAAASGALALVSEAADGTTSTQIIGPSGASVASSPGSALSWSPDGSFIAIRGDSGDELMILTVR